jgi:hypothetical protein
MDMKPDEKFSWQDSGSLFSVTARKLIFPIMALAVFLTAYSVSSNWLAFVEWYSSHKVQTDREKQAEVVLVAALDDRLDGTGALPDTLMLYWPETHTFESIDRGWTFSRLRPETSLVESYLGVSDCKTFCGIQGVYAQSFLSSWGQETRESALEILRAVIATEYELDNLALVVFDLEWSKSFFKCLGPLELDVRERIPIGGQLVNGTLQNFRGYIEPGKQLLSPQEVYWFGRARDGSSNSARMNRQEEIVESILENSSRIKVLTCLQEATGYLVFDFTSEDLGMLYRTFLRNN